MAKTETTLPPLARMTAPTKRRTSYDDDEPEDGAAEVEYVRVTNKRPRLLHLPDLVTVSVEGADPRIAGVGTGKSLTPGGNNVERRYWETVKRHREVRSWLRLKWIEEGGDVEQPEGVEPPPSLAEFGPDAAILTVKGEEDPSVLSRWLATEKRAEVRTAIKQTMEARGKAKGAQ